MTEPRWTLQSIGTQLAVHIAGDKDRDEKTDAMYKIIVTGNGEPALPEVVRSQGEWIEGQKNIIKDKRTTSQEYTRGIILLVIGEFFTILGGIAAVLISVHR